MTVARRSVLLAGLTALAGCGGPEYSGPSRTLAIAAGEEGGFYLAFARLLAGQITATEPGLECVARSTLASQANVELLRAGKADLALVLADTAQTALAGNHPYAAQVPMRALGRVYENYMQLVVRANGPIRGIADLTGRAVSLGASGSGAALFGDRLVEVADIQPRVTRLPLADAVASLADGRVDALLWSGGVPTPALADLDARIGIRLVSLDNVAPRLRAGHGPVYDSVIVPSGAYRHVRDVRTIGVANLLVCPPSLPDDIAGAIVSVLVRRAAELVPQQALGTQFLDSRTLIATAGVPLHPGAAAMYRDLHG
ncbi:TAXI family TRAP transporter solute-binding subunit [Kibdelosporangium phytohabitans]|uniref:C4-dicarboxylate ABC transporter substrate-binding protein n=1 Tax=Kibdelosporangium phytohabitans TaxID=860235 RepID=A0A0N9HPJ7_9PSEU|nr:TAXI family TRAP transporter solute-binding subunit [Kibdelosporangium phytohabitans]ALG08920.1 C4-dicarboxylate ABC transporter substrate-binding protein [Kibdelosporangium phytohabitans]MBE1469919.1 TRAP transporter TAXI family solute receptor [Kibdelosporangium phytohabitans]